MQKKEKLSALNNLVQKKTKLNKKTTPNNTK